MLDSNTPILIGVGEVSERLHDADYRGLSPVQLAANAVKQALADARSHEALASHVDMLGAVRTFEDTWPQFETPFGRSNNFPRSIARHAGVHPKRTIWAVSGGQSPQHLLSELCVSIAAGEASMALLTGAEAISTTRHLMARRDKADWSETVAGSVDDRGPGIDDMLTPYMIRHRLDSATAGYALLENARRARLGLSGAAYRREMAELFAPFSRVAAANPHAMSRVAHPIEDLTEFTDANRMIADPYPRRVIARDQVNQAAALLLTSIGKARELRIDEAKWVYLHGYADLTEQSMLERVDLSRSPAAILCARAALQSAGVGADKLAFLDLYSCFPVAVFNICEGLDLSRDDPRNLTVTGGLPFFGGPGNNYSMHAVASIARRLRASPGSFGFVGANGGIMSKYSAGVYSTAPASFKVTDQKTLQKQIDTLPKRAVAYEADGLATIESYTLLHKDGRPVTAVIAGRMREGGQRCLANQREEDIETLQQMQADEPLGRTIRVTTTPRGNRFAFADS
jgi:acetyl-CoA C-acetyltransferase